VKALSGPRVNIQPEPGSTLGRETLRNLSMVRRAGDRRHSRQWLLRYEIRARPRVGNDRFPQIGPAIAAEIAAVADLGPELLGRVRSAARLAERHRMVRTQREEQRSESDEEQHDDCIVVLEAKPVKRGGKIVRWKVWILVDNSRAPHTSLQLLRWIALSSFAGTFPPGSARPCGETRANQRTSSGGRYRSFFHRARAALRASSLRSSAVIAAYRARTPAPAAALPPRRPSATAAGFLRFGIPQL
jgi:hypothetical protein